MGVYIEAPTTFGKAYHFIEEHGAKQVAVTDELEPDQLLICVVENGMFEAAAVVYDEYELEAFQDPSDPRPRTWLSMDRDTVIGLNPEVARYL